MRSTSLLASLAVVLAPAAAAQATAGNILLVIADDVGVYELASYGEGTDCVTTPVIDGLAQGGMLFRNCWSNPICSPTRATIQTGRYSIETGMGSLLTASFGLQLTELTLAEELALSPAGYARAFFGKWHLSNMQPETGRLFGPNLAGYDHAVWTLQNLVPPEDSFFHWTEIENGVESLRDGYVTVATVDSALEWVATAPEPWFVVLAFHASHDPYHEPPAGLYTNDLTGASELNPRPYYKAALEALDHELGRFLDGLGETLAATDVIFVGDNGSPPPVIGPPGVLTKAKGSIFEGGINVPLLIRGPSVPAAGTQCDGLVNTTDLFATILGLAGVEIAPETYAELELNTISLVPYFSDPLHSTLRELAYAERFWPSGFVATTYHGAARDRRYKLHASAPPLSFRLYDLKLDPFESVDLLGSPLSPGAQLAYDKLRAEILKQIASYGS